MHWMQQNVCIVLNWIGPEQVLCICGLVPPGRSQVEAVYLLKNSHSCCQGRLTHPYLEFPFSPAPWGTGMDFQTPPCFWSTLLTSCLLWASLVAQLVRNLPAVGRPRFNPWVWKIPWRRGRLLTLVFWPGEFQCPCTYALVLIIIMDLEVSLGLGKPKWKRIMTGNAFVYSLVGHYFCEFSTFTDAPGIQDLGSPTGGRWSLCLRNTS